MAGTFFVFVNVLPQPRLVPDVQEEFRKYWLNNYKMNGQKDNDRGGMDKEER